MFLPQLMWLLEEAFRGDSEEFRGIRGAIFIEDGLTACFAVFPQAFVFGTQNARPDEIPRMPLADAVSGQQRRAIHRSVFLVKLMREFVENQIGAVGRLRRTRQRR